MQHLLSNKTVAVLPQTSWSQSCVLLPTFLFLNILRVCSIGRVLVCFVFFTFWSGLSMISKISISFYWQYAGILPEIIMDKVECICMCVPSTDIESSTLRPSPTHGPDLQSQCLHCIRKTKQKQNNRYAHAPGSCPSHHTLKENTINSDHIFTFFTVVISSSLFIAVMCGFNLM